MIIEERIKEILRRALKKIKEDEGHSIRGYFQAYDTEFITDLHETFPEILERKEEEDYIKYKNLIRHTCGEKSLPFIF